MKTLKIENLICINLQSNNEHLFAVARLYDLDFELIIKLKEGNGIYPDKVSKLWVDVVSYEVVAGIFVVDIYKNLKKEDQENLGFFHSNDFKLTDDEVSAIKKIKVVSTPKIKKDEETISIYKMAIENGYDLSIRSLDEKIGIDNDYLLVETGSERVSDISIAKLEKMMLEAVEDEDYELAARLRDQINSRK